MQERRQFSKAVTLLLAAMIGSGLAQAQETTRFLEGKEDGWFWYKDPKDAPKPKTPQTTQAAKPAESKKVEPFSVEWLRNNMPKLLEDAVNDPSKENVEAYLYAQRIALDKAQNYAGMTQKVIYADPFLDENNRVPMTSFAKPYFLKAQMDAQEVGLKELSKHAGIWMFYDSKCGYCRSQAYTIEEFRKTYGFEVKYISMDGQPLHLPDGTKLPTVRDNGHAALLKLRVTPTTVLVAPPSSYLIVSQGLMAQSQLGDRLLVAADSERLLPANMLKAIRPYDRGVLRTEDLKDGASNDPKQWIKYLKERLNGRY